MPHRHLILQLFWGLGILAATISARAQYPGAEPPPQEYQPGFESITSEQSRQWLSILAGDSFAGRGTGQEGYIKAAHFVAGKLAEFGFEPIGDNGTYFQNIALNRVGPNAEASFIGGPDELRISGTEQVVFTGFSDPPSVTGGAILLNIHGNDQTLGEGVSLRDKVVLLVAENVGFRYLRNLREQGPVAIIQVSEELPRSRFDIVRGDGTARRSSSMSATLTPEAAARIVEALKGNAEWLEPLTEPGLQAHSLDGELTVESRVIHEPLFVPNVVGWLEGSDPELRHQYITIGAHLDHLGTREDATFPGADDNGSGSTALLQIAQALASNPVRPKRSVLYIGFAAEERGLIGSRYYCDHPIKPLEDMVCMLNIDMIGRNEERGEEKAEENEDTIHLVGSRRTNDLHELVMRANQHVHLKFEYDEEGVFNRSDQAPFANAGIPVTFLFGGFNPHYHATTDNLEGINFDKIAAAAKLNYLTLMMAAEHGPFANQASAAEPMSEDQ